MASPLALATLLSEQTGNPGAADFLSSVEICVVDHADVISMQNWTHLLTGVHIVGWLAVLLMHAGFASFDSLPCK